MYFIQNFARNKNHSDIFLCEFLNILIIRFQRSDGIITVRRILGVKIYKQISSLVGKVTK